MESVRLEKLILNRIHQSIDMIIVIAAVISLFSTVAVYFGSIPLIYAVIDGVIGVGLLALYFLRSKVSPKVKVVIVVFIPILLGIATFFDGGFSSGTIILILLGNATAMLLLRKHVSVIIAILTMMGMLLLWGWTVSTGFDAMPEMTGAKWTIQILLLLLFLFVFRISLYSIKNYLMENIEELEKSIELTKNLAYYDTLTGLPNYNCFVEYIKESELLESPSGIVMIISLKNLNVINAVYGNEDGNQMLLRTGEELKRFQNDETFIARVSSNEFAIWMRSLNVKYDLEGKILAILNVINQHKETEGTHKIEFYTSYAKLDVSLDTALTCYQNAQIALTYAKYMNSETLVAYDEEFDLRMKRFSNLKELLKREVENWHHIHLYYQPQYDTESLKITSVEALSRWSTKEYGEISPLEFIPIIEELHLHDKFGIAVIERAFVEYPGLQEKYGFDTTISVNVSPACLLSISFAEKVVRLLKKHEFPPSKLTLEITEELVIEGVESVNKKLMPLRQMGVKVSLDDFGTGFSSLSYLPRLEVDEIKLDKSLIDQIVISEKSRVLIQSLIHLAREYHLIVVAEGVESKTQCDLLCSMGCNLIQGYFIGEAVPLPEMEVKIENKK